MARRGGHRYAEIDDRQCGREGSVRSRSAPRPRSGHRARAAARAAPGIADRPAHRTREAASSLRRCQAASVMSGPIPAGSPSVSARGSASVAPSPFYLYSIIAALRISLRKRFDIGPGIAPAYISSRTCRCAGVSAVVCFLSHSANNSIPCCVTSGGVSLPTGMLSRISRSCGADRPSCAGPARAPRRRAAGGRRRCLPRNPGSACAMPRRRACAPRLPPSRRTARHHEQDRAQRVVDADGGLFVLRARLQRIRISFSLICMLAWNLPRTIWSRRCRP